MQVLAGGGLGCGTVWDATRAQRLRTATGFHGTRKQLSFLPGSRGQAHMPAAHGDAHLVGIKGLGMSRQCHERLSQVERNPAETEHDTLTFGMMIM